MEPEMLVRKVACASCGAPMSVPDDIDRLTCARCGSDLIIQRGEGFIASNQADQATTATPPDRLDGRSGQDDSQVARDEGSSGAPLTCPSCRQADQLWKLTEIRDAAASQKPGQKLNKQGKELARSLAFAMLPPAIEKPNRQVGLVTGCASLVLALVVFGLCASSGETWGIAVGAIIALALVILGVTRWRGKNEKGVESGPQPGPQQIARYQAAQQRYDRANYCLRCASVVVSGENVAIPLSQWQASLVSTPLPLSSPDTHAEPAQGGPRLTRYQGILDVMIDSGLYSLAYFDHDTELPSPYRRIAHHKRSALQEQPGMGRTYHKKWPDVVGVRGDTCSLVVEEEREPSAGKVEQDIAIITRCRYVWINGRLVTLSQPTLFILVNSQYGVRSSVRSNVGNFRRVVVCAKSEFESMFRQHCLSNG
jgi:hypothetical protein